MREWPSEIAHREGLIVEETDAPHRVGPLSFRARLERNKITLFKHGLSEVDHPNPRELAIAHELYHWFHPRGTEAQARSYAEEWLKRLLLIALVFLSLGAAPKPPDILLVPLDDRPANLLFVRQIARIGGARMKAPERYLLGHWLTPGQPEKIAEWARKQRYDAAIISADMWCYGGLVASRSAATSEQQALERARSLPGKARVFAILPRLSLRTSDRQAPHERTLAYWAQKPGAPPPQGVPPEIVEEYLAVRKRNLNVLKALIADPRLEQLVIGQDDSAATGLHREEQQELLALMQGKPHVRLISGADELAMDMVSGYLAERAQTRIKVRVVYSDPAAKDKIPPLESLPLQDMIRDHLELAGAVEAEPAEVVLMIQVPDAKPFELPKPDRKPISEAFARSVAEMMKTHRVAVADLSLVNRMDPYLAQAVIDEIPLWKLEGFAAWNTPANALGTAVAQLVVHRLAARPTGWSEYTRLDSEKTHQAFLLARLIDDYGYQAIFRTEIAPKAANLPPDPDRLLNLYGPIDLEGRLKLIAWAHELFRSKFQGRVTDGARIERMDLEVIMPWQRTFEVEARVNLVLEPL